MRALLDLWPKDGVALAFWWASQHDNAKGCAALVRLALDEVWPRVFDAHGEVRS